MAAAADDGFVPDDDGFVPDAPPVAKTPAAPFIPEKPPTFGEALSSGIGSILKGVGEATIGGGIYREVIGKPAEAAARAAEQVVTHPVASFTDPAAKSRLREAMRGVNDNIPGGNLLVEHLPYGPPASDPGDEAAAPGFRPLGMLLGTPVGGMLNEAAAPALIKGGQMLGAGLDASMARSAARGATPIRDAAATAATDLKTNAAKAVREAGAGLALGHMAGHGTLGAGIGAGLRLGAPVTKLGGVVADEGIAALARKFGRGQSATSEAALPVFTAPEADPPTARAGWSPEPPAVTTSLATEPDPTTSRAAWSPEPADVARVTPLHPEADAMLAKVVGAAKDGNRFAQQQVAKLAATPQGAARIAAAEAGGPAASPTWIPSKFDDKYARKLGMSVEDYRADAVARRVRAADTLKNPHATPRQKLEAGWTLRSNSNIPAKGEAIEAAEEASP